MFTLASLPLTAHIQPTHGRTSTRMADELLTRARATLALMRDDRDAPLREQGSGGQPAAQSTISARESVDAITARHRRDSTPQGANRQPVPPPPPPPAPLQRPRPRDRRNPPQRIGTRRPTPRKSCRRQVQRRELQTRGPSQLPSRSTCVIAQARRLAATCERHPRAERGPTSPQRSPPTRSVVAAQVALGLSYARALRRAAACGLPSRLRARLRSCLAPSQRPRGRPWRTLARAVR